MMPATIVQELGLVVPSVAACPAGLEGKEAIGLRLPTDAGVASMPPPTSSVPAGQEVVRGDSGTWLVVAVEVTVLTATMVAGPEGGVIEPPEAHSPKPVTLSPVSPTP